MFIADKLTDYTILDTGEGMKLERWGKFTLSRPDPQAIWEKQDKRLWKSADAEYSRSSSGGGRWMYNTKLPERWVFNYGDLRFYVRPTGFKHTGLFPEQSANWDFMMNKLASKKGARVLNLFAYTGGATVACASAGASVTHVDAAKSMVAWAKENAALSGLCDAPIRYIVDDCLKFVLREQRRGKVYDAILMDPPSYGRGADGQVWRCEDDLFNLVKETAKLLSDDPLFFMISSYTTGLSSVVIENMLKICVAANHGGKITSGDLVIPVKNQSVLLPCGNTARWEK